ncbi:hypothetical protein JKP88DRAFT_226172 [Tribonema minus]|uniref:Secreted protein n=1 Tax=Tribonema minus TaxID=303371 RepID=A0A836C9L7_9STRA|nr:hypothetical protein JKP88DRAFT_226172 [Tribonema minus]
MFVWTRHRAIISYSLIATLASPLETVFCMPCTPQKRADMLSSARPRAARVFLPGMRSFVVQTPDSRHASCLPSSLRP